MTRRRSSRAVGYGSFSGTSLWVPRTRSWSLGCESGPRLTSRSGRRDRRTLRRLEDSLCRDARATARNRPPSRLRVLRGEFVLVQEASKTVAAANADQVFPIDLR